MLVKRHPDESGAKTLYTKGHAIGKRVTGKQGS